MKKRILSLLLTLIMVFSLFPAVSATGIGDYPALELETDLVITSSDIGYTYVTFTPENSGSYVFYAKGTGDTEATLHTADMLKLYTSDDCWKKDHGFHDPHSFCIPYDLDAGQTYVLGAAFCSGKIADMTIRVDRNHNYEVADTREPTCTEEGAIIWVCADCGYSYSEILPIQHTYAETITKEPTCTEEGELTFTCTICGDSYTEVIPALYEYWVYEDHVEITDYTGDATELVIPAEIEGLPVTSIWEYAFWGCDSLTEVTIPDTVQSLGDNSFSGCDALRRVTIGKRVWEIGCAAFSGCKNLTEIIFRGTAPRFLTTTDGTAWYTFYEVTATAYYPANDGTWTNWKRQNYDGNITWVPYCPDSAHEYTTVVTAPTCTAQGYTTYTCACGDSYVGDYVDALGHSYVDGFCTRCGEADPDYVKPVENPFTDVPAGCWYEAPVLWALENGVTSGSSETTFSPGDKCLRAHVVTFLWNAEKTPEPTAYTKSFSDVPAGAWYYKPVHWAVEHGITSGVSDTKFGAGDVCSRYQVVFFLWKAAGSPEPKTTVNPFTDVNPGHFFYKAVLWAVENGITSGTSATTFGPTAPCNRAQVVTFLYAAYN